METGTQPTVLVVDDDLFFSVRIETTLKKLGYAARVIGKETAAVAFAAEVRPALVIVNFGSGKLPAAEIVRQCKALPDPAPVLSFMPHVRMPELRPLAKAAGADLVVANSALTMRLPQLVEKLAPRDGSAANIAAAAPFAEAEEEE